MTYKKDDIVNFERNESLKKNNARIIAVSTIKGFKEEDTKVSYIIEHVKGFVPDDKRIALYGLDANKKYLFVIENELSAI